jgi:hypothetical protein
LACGETVLSVPEGFVVLEKNGMQAYRLNTAIVVENVDWRASKRMKTKRWRVLHATERDCSIRSGSFVLIGTMVVVAFR